MRAVVAAEVVDLSSEEEDRVAEPAAVELKAEAAVPPGRGSAPARMPATQTHTAAPPAPATTPAPAPAVATRMGSAPAARPQPWYRAGTACCNSGTAGAAGAGMGQERLLGAV